MIITPITPRVSETDGAGHINNCFVPIWFEAGRREIFRVLSPTLGFDPWRAALVNMNVDYTAQIFYHDEAQVHTWIERVGNKSFTVGEQVWQNDQCCAKGTAVYVNFDFNLQRSMPLPLEVVKVFNSPRFHRPTID